MILHTRGDAAFASGLDGTSFEEVGGYFGGPLAYHVWPASDWAKFPGLRLPIWVGGNPGNGVQEGREAVGELERLGVPAGCRIALDMETRRDVEYVSNFGGVLHDAGYLVEVYGSASTVFSNPPLNGYWVADYTPDMAMIAHLLASPHVRGVQWKAGPLYDSSLVKAWTEGQMWHG